MRLLEAPAPAEGPASAEQEQAWFEALLRWLLQRDRLPSLGAPDRSGRLRALAAVVDEHPRRDALLARMSAVWTHASSVRLLAEMGLPDHTSFLKEAAQRLTDRFVPLLDPQEDLYALVDRLRFTEDEVRWLEGLPEATLRRWSVVFAPSTRSYAIAATLLSVRAAALGLSRELIARDRAAEGESVFFALPEVVRALAQEPGDAALLARWTQTRLACEQVVSQTMARLDRRGLSVELVYRLELVRATLARLDQLLQLAAGGGQGFALAVELVRGSASQHSLRELLRGTLRSLALRVVEHTAHTGEHYIASTRAEWWAMLRSASGGGALTALTACFKYGLAALPLAPAVMGMAHALNYSLSFIALQLLGLSLASKQPAMTGSALADALDQRSGQAAEIELVASIARTQLVAALGNVALAVPVALLLDLALRPERAHLLPPRAGARVGRLRRAAHARGGGQGHRAGAHRHRAARPDARRRFSPREHHRGAGRERHGQDHPGAAVPPRGGAQGRGGDLLHAGGSRPSSCASSPAASAGTSRISSSAACSRSATSRPWSCPPTRSSTASARW
jgi:site-specific recombinase